MAQYFSRGADTFARILIFGGASALVSVLAVSYLIVRSHYETMQNVPREQPVQFSHKHHVGGLGIDCRYCHSSVEFAPSAGLPATETCMTCHSQIWANAAMLAPVRQSLAENKPLRWRRVYTLPDYVYFDHSIHVAKGVGCTECHGPIGDMPLTWRATDLTMGWCLDCHRNPAPRLRPREAVFNPHWQRTVETPSGAQLMASYRIHPRTLSDCTVCHR